MKDANKSKEHRWIYSLKLSHWSRKECPEMDCTLPDSVKAFHQTCGWYSYNYQIVAYGKGIECNQQDFELHQIYEGTSGIQKLAFLLVLSKINSNRSLKPTVHRKWQHVDPTLCLHRSQRNGHQSSCISILFKRPRTQCSIAELRTRQRNYLFKMF